MKTKERIQKFNETGDSRYIYRNELDKACLNMIQFMEVSNIYHKEQLPKSYYMINHLIMIVIDRDRTCFCFKCYKSNFNYGC